MQSRNKRKKREMLAHQPFIFPQRTAWNEGQTEACRWEKGLTAEEAHKKEESLSCLLLLLLSHFSHVWLCVIPETAAHQTPRPWDSPGKNAGVGCHFLLQCMKVKSESEVAQSYPTLSDPMDCSLPGSSAHGIFQARVLEWGAIAFSDLIVLVKTLETKICNYGLLGGFFWPMQNLNQHL